MKKIISVLVCVILSLCVSMKSYAMTYGGIDCNEIGRAINLLKNSTNLTASMKGTVFDLTEDDLIHSNGTSWEDSSYLYYGTKSYTSKIESQSENEISVMTPVMNLGAASKMGINLNASRNELENTMYMTYTVKKISKTIYLKDSSNVENYISKETPFFLKQVKKINDNPTQKNIDDFINIFGTHLIMAGNYGYQANFIYSYYNKDVFIKSDVDKEHSVNLKGDILIDNIPVSLVNNIKSNVNCYKSASVSETDISSSAYGLGYEFDSNMSTTKELSAWEEECNKYNMNTLISYPKGYLANIYDYISDEYMYAKTALKEYIDNNLKIDFNSQCDSYTFSKTDTSCFMAGGGKNVWKYTFEKLPFNVMKNAGYSTVRISFTIDLERKTSDSAYLSVWLDSNMTNYFSGWDKVKLKKGWGTYEFIVNRDGKEDINLSDLNVDKLTMKFDAWGSWKYQVGTRTINLEFK